MLKTVAAVIFGAIFVGILLAVVFHRRKIERVWRDLADTYGLELSQDEQRGQFTLDGDFGGRVVHVDYTQAQEAATSYRTELAETVPTDLAVYEETSFRRAGSLFDERDVEVERDDVDEPFVVKGDDEKSARAFLDREEVAEVLTALRDLADDVRLAQGALTIEHEHHPESADVFEKHLTALVEAAEVLEKAAKT
jgi:hypothetical protein